MINTNITLKAICPNPKDPFKVDPKQLAELDAEILKRFPEAKLTEGCKFARWAEFDGIKISEWKASPMADSKYDHNFQIFYGTILGKQKTILMFLPYFD